jgi:hypothetical protein
MNNSLELIKETENWNLRSDETLLKSLKSFSDNLKERASLLVQSLDDLNFETVEVECNLKNTFNEFLMLVDTQFIENVSLLFINLYRSIKFLYIQIFVYIYICICIYIYICLS